MVSFQCDGCGDTIKKPQLDKHRNRCWATFSCIDCSTTFHGTEYKAHTSCISEAEKYQGALYKGKKANGHAGNNAPSSAKEGRYAPYPTSKPGKPTVETAAEPVAEPEAAAPVPEAAAPAIHPSRTALLNNPAPANPRQNGRPAAFPGLHPGSTYPPPRNFGRNARQGGMSKTYATGMNGVAGEAPMRSWGGSPVPEDGAQGGAEMVVDSVGVVDVEKKKKKKKKGDKGGTGSRANSSRRQEEEGKAVAVAEAEAVAAAEAPVVVVPATPMASDAQHTRTEDAEPIKRKADEDAVCTSKTAKKLRKALHSIASTQEPKASVPLATLIEKISAELSSSKKKKSEGVIDATGIARDIKVSFQEGRWVLDV